MTNEEKTVALIWIDAGVYTAQRVAQYYKMQEQELLDELSSFEHQMIYEQYQSMVREETYKRLKNIPYTEWNSMFAYRTLDTGRLDCIGWNRSYNTYQQFYFTDKATLAQLPNTRQELDKDHILKDYKESYPSTSPAWDQAGVDAQLHVLLGIYDPSDLTDMCRTLSVEEATRIYGKPLDDPSEEKPNNRINNNRQNGGMPPEQMAIREQQIVEVSTHLHNRHFAYVDQNKMTQEVDISSDEFSWLLDLIGKNDTERLQHIADGNLHSLETRFFYHVDPFYKAYALDQLIEQGKQEHNFDACFQQALTALCNLYRSMPVFEDFVTSVEEILKELVESYTDSHQLTTTLEELNQLIEHAPSPSCSEWVAYLWMETYEGQIAAEDRIWVKTALVKLGSGSSTQSEDDEKRSEEEETTAAQQAPQTTTQVASPAADPNLPDLKALMERRKQLLDEINPDEPHPSQLPEFLETENLLLSLAPQYRPAEYPEPHLTLARLYVSRIVPTPVAIVNRLFNALSPEQLAQF